MTRELFTLVIQMRLAQMNYFKYRTAPMLYVAKELEKKVDEIIKQLQEQEKSGHLLKLFP